VFCNDIDSSSFSGTWRRIKRELNLSRCLPNTSTFVPNDRLQCLYCVLPIMRCALAAHLDVSLAERPTPCRLTGTVHVFFPRFREDGHLWLDRIAWYVDGIPRMRGLLVSHSKTLGVHVWYELQKCVMCSRECVTWCVWWQTWMSWSHACVTSFRLDICFGIVNKTFS